MPLITEDFMASQATILSFTVSPGEAKNVARIKFQIPAVESLVKSLGVHSSVFHRVGEHFQRNAFESISLDLEAKACLLKCKVPNLPQGHLELHVDEVTGFELIMLKDDGLTLRFRASTTGALSGVISFLEAVTSTAFNLHLRPLDVQTELPDLVPAAIKASLAVVDKARKAKGVN